MLFRSLRIYIHYPSYRDRIIDELEEKDLLFNVAEHRFLWQQIIAIEDETPGVATHNYLLGELHNRSLDFPEQMKKVTKLFHLDEKTIEDVFRTEVRVAEAIASIELVSYQKRAIYCEEQLRDRVPNNESDIEVMKYYAEELCIARGKIKELKQAVLFHSTNLS